MQVLFCFVQLHLTISKCDKRTIKCDVGTPQWGDGTVTHCDKRTITYDKRTVTCDKNRTNAMLVLLNITIEPSNLRKKKINEPLCVTRELSNVILELQNVRKK